MRNIGHKLIQLSYRDWRDLASAQLALVVAQIRVWMRCRGDLVAPSSQPPAPFTNIEVDPAVERLAWAVERTAGYGLFRPKCLVRAIALAHLIEARGFSGSRVRIGVIWQNERFMAHAWVVYRGSILGDQNWRIRRFAELNDVELCR